MSRASCRARLSSVLLALVVASVLWPTSSAAQRLALADSPVLADASLEALLVSSTSVAPFVPQRSPSIVETAAEPRLDIPQRRPAALPALYASFATLQALDIHSTFEAVRAGRTEANPAMQALVPQPGAFIAAKVAATAGTIYLTERLWRRHRASAVLLMVALNGTYAAIVANNYKGRGGMR